MTNNSGVERIELRCPVGAQRLLAISRVQGGYRKIVDGNLLELACRDCRATITKQKNRKPKYVLHRFNVLGELVETEVIYADNKIQTNADIMDEDFSLLSR